MILARVETRARHGYELAKLIEPARAAWCAGARERKEPHPVRGIANIVTPQRSFTLPATS